MVFVNGLPLAVVELKNAADEDATIWSAYPPDLQEGATKTVLAHAELLCADWAC
ncbi:MAG: hypothetical protein ABMA26_05635 [Limisphaerales bacterium]